MESKQSRIYESDDEVNRSGDSDEDGAEHGYCFSSVPTSKLQARKKLSTACWVSDMRMAEVKAPKGKIWERIGIVRHGTTYCSIEEVLYLVELGGLDVKDDVGTSLSLEDLYAKLSDEKNGCWNYFQAYKELKSLGYIVGRHGVPWSLKSVNSEFFSERCRETEAGSGSEDEVSIIGKFSRMQIDQAKIVFDVYPPNCKFKKSCPGKPSFVLCFTRRYPPSKAMLEILGEECGVPLKVCHVEQGKVSFYSFDKVDLPVLLL